MTPLYGTCPNTKCEQPVTALDVATVTAHGAGGRPFHGVTFLCPNCQTVLGAGLDPVAFAKDVAEHLDRLR